MEVYIKERFWKGNLMAMVRSIGKIKKAKLIKGIGEKN
jgi:hypothetical protein